MKTDNLQFLVSKNNLKVGDKVNCLNDLYNPLGGLYLKKGIYELFKTSDGCFMVKGEGGEDGANVGGYYGDFALVAEDNKLKLTKDDIGKNFETRDGSICTMSLFSSYESCFEMKLSNHVLPIVLFVVNNLSNLCVSCNRAEWDVVKRHEPRWWLKDLPDADCLVGAGLRYEWLSFSTVYDKWYNTEDEPKINSDNDDLDCEEGKVCAMGCLNMPQLKLGDWQLSKISITELREWQKVNK